MHLHRRGFTKYFVLQSLRKALPSTTLHYKACTECFPVLLCTVTQNIPNMHQALHTATFYTQQSFTKRSFYTQQPFTHSKLLHTASFDTQQAFTDCKLLHTASFYTQQPWCRHTNAIHNSQLQKLIVLRRQPHERGTLTQPLQCDLQALNCETQKNCAQRRQKLQLQNLSAPKGKITILMNFHTEKIYWKITIAAAPIRFTTLSCKGQ